MDSAWTVAVFVVALLVGLWAVTMGKSKYYLAKQELAKKIKLFSPDYFVGYDGKGAIALDKKTRKILLVAPDGSNQKVVTFPDLLAAALVEDGGVITKTTASGLRGLTREAAAALTRDFPLGGPEQAKTTDGLARRIELRLTLADQADPYYLVVFLDNGPGLARTSKRYAQARSQADRWSAQLQVLIQQADDDEARPRQTQWSASAVA